MVRQMADPAPNVLSAQCPTRLVLDLIADKWTALVIYLLAGGTRRYGELQRSIGGISQKMLTQTLRRLEDKGYVEHDVEGRTYVYRPRIEQQSVATQQVRGIVDRFCRGSVENLLVGMVDDDLISPEKLRELAERISRADAARVRDEA